MGSYLPEGIPGTRLKLPLPELYVNYLSKIAGVERRVEALLVRVARATDREPTQTRAL